MMNRFRITVSSEERFLVLMYRTASPVARAVAGYAVMQAFENPLPHEKAGIGRAFNRAARSLRIRAIHLKDVAKWAERQRRLLLGLISGGGR